MKNVSVKTLQYSSSGGFFIIGDQERVCQTLQLH